MKKLFFAISAALIVAFCTATSACGGGNDAPQGSVNLVAVTALEVGVREDVDYFVVPEPAASTKVGAIDGLDFAGDLQELYGGEAGYPQAVVVVKNELLSYVATAFSSALTANKEWLLAESTSAETIVSTVQANLAEGMTPTFNAKNLSKQVIQNCGIDFVSAASSKQEVISFMQKLNAVSETNFGEPADNFFVTGDENYGDAVYDGSISVYAPDGAPALGLAKLMVDGNEFYNGQVEFNIVNADLIQTYVAGNSPVADICVLPVNAAVKLLGSGENYKMLGTLTHGNLFMVSSSGEAITPDNVSSLAGKTVGVVNLAAVPGLTFKVILDKYNLDYETLQ